jgi:phosphate transport system ATP-binding protein
MSHIGLRNYSISYGPFKALQRMSVDIPDGQITAIIGPSGCGKTTLLKGLNRLIDLYEDVKVEGEVLIDGRNIFDPSSDVLELRKRVGFLSQKPYPLPMSISDNILFGPKIHGMDDEQISLNVERVKEVTLAGRSRDDHPPRHTRTGRCTRAGRRRGKDSMVEHYLRLSGLWDDVKDRLDSPASKLSVGQQQRLALARALAVEPEVILADEPTSALDPVSSRLIEERFKLLKRRYTIVMVTHILRQARRIADYVLFLYMGELVEHGPAREVLENPADPRTRAYITGEIS